MGRNREEAFRTTAWRQAQEQSKTAKQEKIEKPLDLSDFLSNEIPKAWESLPDEVKAEWGTKIEKGVSDTVAEAEKKGSLEKALKWAVDKGMLPVELMTILLTLFVMAGCKEKGVETGDVKEAATNIRTTAKESKDYQEKYVMPEARVINLLELPLDQFNSELTEELARLWAKAENANDPKKADLRKKILELQDGDDNYYYKFYYTSRNGSDGTETDFKISRVVRLKTEILSVKPSYLEPDKESIEKIQEREEVARKKVALETAVETATVEQVNQLLQYPVDDFTMDDAYVLAHLWAKAENANNAKKTDLHKKVQDLIYGGDKKAFRIKYTSRKVADGTETDFQIIDITGPYKAEVHPIQ